MQRTKKEHRVFVHARVERSLKCFGVLDLIGGKVSGVWIKWSEYGTLVAQQKRALLAKGFRCLGPSRREGVRGLD